MALASSSPLVYRTAVVATGVLCPAAQGRPAAVAAVMQLLSGCIHRPAATMRAWGRGEDHVAAVTFWRLAVSCPAELAPSFHQLAADFVSSAEVTCHATSPESFTSSSTSCSVIMPRTLTIVFMRQMPWHASTDQSRHGLQRLGWAADGRAQASRPWTGRCADWYLPTPLKQEKQKKKKKKKKKKKEALLCSIRVDEC